MYVYVHVCTHIQVCIYLLICMCTFVHVYTCMCLNVYIHTPIVLSNYTKGQEWEKEHKINSFYFPCPEVFTENSAKDGNYWKN